MSTVLTAILCIAIVIVAFDSPRSNYHWSTWFAWAIGIAALATTALLSVKL